MNSIVYVPWQSVELSTYGPYHCLFSLIHPALPCVANDCSVVLSVNLYLLHSRGLRHPSDIDLPPRSFSSLFSREDFRCIFPLSPLLEGPLCLMLKGRQRWDCTVMQVMHVGCKVQGRARQGKAGRESTPIYRACICRYKHGWKNHECLNACVQQIDE
jgi:hypothetical protein